MRYPTEIKLKINQETENYCYIERVRTTPGIPRQLLGFLKFS